MIEKAEVVTQAEILRARRRAIALARRVEMPVRLGPETPFRWDGRTLRISPRMGFPTITHEVAHWLLCPKQRRTVPEYGLGTVFSMIWWTSDAPRAPRLVSTAAAEHEEQLALMLGIVYGAALGLPWRPTADAFHRVVCPGFRACDEQHHRSLAEFVDSYDDIADELRGRKVLAADGLPIPGRLRSWLPAAKIR